MVDWDLVVLLALHCTLLLHCLGQVGPIFTFRLRRVRRHWTFFVFDLFISLDWNGLAWISQGCHVTVVRVSVSIRRHVQIISHFGKLFSKERCWGVDYGDDFNSLLCQIHDTLISGFHFRSVVPFSVGGSIVSHFIPFTYTGTLYSGVVVT